MSACICSATQTYCFMLTMAVLGPLPSNQAYAQPTLGSAQLQAATVGSVTNARLDRDPIKVAAPLISCKCTHTLTIHTVHSRIHTRGNTVLYIVTLA